MDEKRKEGKNNTEYVRWPDLILREQACSNIGTFQKKSWRVEDTLKPRAKHLKISYITCNCFERFIIPASYPLCRENELSTTSNPRGLGGLKNRSNNVDRLNSGRESRMRPFAALSWWFPGVGVGRSIRHYWRPRRGFLEAWGLSLSLRQFDRSDCRVERLLQRSAMGRCNTECWLLA